jgi:hypothetical protein
MEQLKQNFTWSSKAPTCFSELWPLGESALTTLLTVLFPGKEMKVERIALEEDYSTNNYFHCRWEARATEDKNSIRGLLDTGGDWRDYMTSGDTGTIEITVERSEPPLHLKVRFDRFGELFLEARESTPEELFLLAKTVVASMNASLQNKRRTA